MAQEQSSIRLPLLVAAPAVVFAAAVGLGGSPAVAIVAAALAGLCTALLPNAGDRTGRTAHLEAETSSLRKDLEYTRSIIESAHEAFISMDALGRIAGWNRRAESTFGWSSSEVIGRPLAEVVVPSRYRERHREGLSRFLATGAATLLNRRIEVKAVHRDGHEFPLELTIMPFKVGEQCTFHAFMRDITERKDAERELRQRAKQQAAVADLGRRALSGIDRLPLMQAAVLRSAETLEVEYAQLFEFGPGAEELVLRAAFGLEEALAGVAKVPIDSQSQAGYALRSGHLVVVDDIRAETRFAGATLLDDRGVISGMSVPIQGEPPFGVLCVHTTQKREFRGDEVQFVQSVANVLGAAIARERAVRLDAQLTEVRAHEHPAVLDGVGAA